MILGVLFLIIYFILVVVLDFLPIGRNGQNSLSAGNSSDEIYFLSGKKMSTVVLLVSTAATNFSAFTILGLSGAGYRLGYAFYPVMAFGTGFMALGMYLIGGPLGELGRKRGYVSPADFIQDRFGSPVLTRLYAAVLVVLTLPYLALQPISAGIILETFFGVPYRAGVIICTVIVALYTIRGGMRAVARTDLIQGIIILFITAAAYAAVTRRFGGFRDVHDIVYKSAPQLLERFGGGKGVGPGVLAGYIVLWFFADPMFPQLNQRFLAAKDSRTLEKTVIIYPVVTMLLFFLTISVGVIGAGVIPGLSVSDSDRIWPVLISRAAGPVLSAIFMIAPLAAIMSTLDSQLLSLSSIVTRDILNKKDSGYLKIKSITLVIAAAGLIIALFPPDNILDFINKSSFLGYAALAPLVFGGLYGKKLNSIGAFSSIICGEGATILTGFGVFSFGSIPPVFVICGISWAAMITGSWFGTLIIKKKKSSGFPVFSTIKLNEKLPVGWAAVFIILFILCIDLINYFMVPEASGPPASGLPGWMYFQAGLCIVLSIVYFVFFRNRRLFP